MVPITTWVAVPLLSPAPRAPSRPLLPPGPGPLPEADTEESQASEKSEASPSSTERENRGGPVSLDAVQAGPQAGGPYHAATKGGTRPPQRPAFVSHVEQQNATQVASEGWAHRLSPTACPWQTSPVDHRAALDPLATIRVESPLEAEPSAIGRKTAMPQASP